MRTARLTRRLRLVPVRMQRCARWRFIRPARPFTWVVTSPVSPAPRAAISCACCRAAEWIRPSIPGPISTARSGRSKSSRMAKSSSAACSRPTVRPRATTWRACCRTARWTPSTSAPGRMIMSPALISRPMGAWWWSATSPPSMVWPAAASPGSGRMARLIPRSTLVSARTASWTPCCSNRRTPRSSSAAASPSSTISRRTAWRA